MSTVTREEALRNPMAHRFRREVGYVRAAPLKGPTGRPPCRPPPGTPLGSFHRLRPPTGGPARTFQWAGTWQAPGGNRVGWTAEYLGAHGWVYADANG